MVPTVIIFFLIAALIGAGFYIHCRNEKARSAAFADVAAELNFAFAVAPEPGFVEGFVIQRFQLGSAGRKYAAKNVMAAAADGTGVTVFEFAFTVGNGKSSSRHNQTVARFTVPHLSSLPRFLLRPRNWTDRWFARFKAKEIVVAADGEFAEHYRVVGEQETRVAAVLKPAVREAILAVTPGVTVEANGDTILFYRPDRRVAPDGVKDFLAHGYTVVAAFRGQSEDRA